MHRDIGFFSNVAIRYRFSGQIIRSKPLTPLLLKIMNYINIISRPYRTGNVEFNSILVNYYKDGDDYIGVHSDNETTLAGDCVAALSLGSKRRFIVKKLTNKHTTKKASLFQPEVCEGVSKVDIEISNGDLLFMSGSLFQKCYTHEIPKQKNIFSPRLSSSRS
jgi:alkylated DNA repair dioxygenase AlkB